MRLARENTEEDEVGIQGQENSTQGPLRHEQIRNKRLGICILEQWPEKRKSERAEEVGMEKQCPQGSGLILLKTPSPFSFHFSICSTSL